MSKNSVWTTKTTTSFRCSDNFIREEKTLKKRNFRQFENRINVKKSSLFGRSANHSYDGLFFNIYRRWVFLWRLENLIFDLGAKFRHVDRIINIFRPFQTYLTQIFAIIFFCILSKTYTLQVSNLYYIAFIF